MDIEAGLLMEYLRFLDFFNLENTKQINQRTNTRQVNPKIAFGNGYVACTGL
jgi:hypothetical protein